MWRVQPTVQPRGAPPPARPSSAASRVQAGPLWSPVGSELRSATLPGGHLGAWLRRDVHALRATRLEEDAAQPVAAGLARSARLQRGAAAGGASPPADALGLVLYQLTLAHDIAAVAPTCHVLCDAVKLALKLRPVLWRGRDARWPHSSGSVRCVASAPDGRIITGSDDNTVKVWRDGVCECTIKAPGTRGSRRWRCCRAERASSASRATAPRSCGRSTALSSAPSRWAATCSASRRCPTACTLWSALATAPTRATSGCTTSTGRSSTPSKGTPRSVYAVAVTPDGQHIISGSDDKRVKVWGVASKSLVSTCTGHTKPFARWRRCPTASASSAAATTPPSACGSSAAPSRTPSS